MTNYVVNRSANRLREASIIEWGGNGVLCLSNIVMTNGVELICGNTGLYMFFNHVQNLSCKTTNDAHLFNFFRGFYGYRHVFIGICGK